MKSYILYFSCLVIAVAHPLIEDTSTVSSSMNNDGFKTRLDNLKLAVSYFPAQLQKVHDKYLNEIQFFINTSITTAKEIDEGYTAAREIMDKPFDDLITILNEQSVKEQVKNVPGAASVPVMKKNLDDYMDAIIKTTGNYKKMIQSLDSANQELKRIIEELPTLKLQPID